MSGDDSEQIDDDFGDDASQDAQPPTTGSIDPEAPYGRRKDGTPKSRPGRKKGYRVVKVDRTVEDTPNPDDHDSLRTLHRKFSALRYGSGEITAAIADLYNEGADADDLMRWFLAQHEDIKRRALEGWEASKGTHTRRIKTTKTVESPDGSETILEHHERREIEELAGDPRFLSVMQMSLRDQVDLLRDRLGLTEQKVEETRIENTTVNVQQTIEVVISAQDELLTLQQVLDATGGRVKTKQAQAVNDGHGEMAEAESGG